MNAHFTLVNLFILVLLSSQVAVARIGETETEIAARYGKPIGAPPPTILKHYAPASSVQAYLKSGLIVIVAIWHGRSAAEYFAQVNDSPMTDADVADLLEANRYEKTHTWKKAELGPDALGQDSWSFPGLTAFRPAQGPYLEITDIDFWDIVTKTEDKRNGEHQLHGF